MQWRLPQLLSRPLHHRDDMLDLNFVEEKVADEPEGVVPDRVPPRRASVAVLP
jgi:hypothetical protein